MLRPDRIIIHHSLTKDSGTCSWSAIHNYHVNVLNWKDIGYHAGLEEIEGRLVCVFGRPATEPGAHTKGQNGRSLGFCFVGSFDEHVPSRPRLRVAARRVLAPWCRIFGISPEQIYPHRDFASYKTCPGTMFDVEELRKLVREELDADN